MYALVPPPAVAIAWPVDPPLHDTFVCVVDTVNSAGCVIVTDVVAVHPLLSVTVTVQVAAVNPVTVAVD